MTISFGGIPLLLSDPYGKVDNFIKKYWSLPTSIINCPPRRIDSRSLCQIPNWPTTPPLRLNQLWMPSGATRWTRGLFLIDDVGMQAIKGVGYAELIMGAEYPNAPCLPACDDSSSATSSSGGWNIGSNFRGVLFKLDPMPVSNKGVTSLYILPLVDERYYWQGMNIVSTAVTWGSSAATPTTSSSSSSGTPQPTLFNDIAKSLASTALGNPSAANYITGTLGQNGVPSAEAFNNGPIGAAAALDLMCWSQNVMLVPEYHTNVTVISEGNVQRYRIIGSGNNVPTSMSTSCNSSTFTPQTIWRGQKLQALNIKSPQWVAGNDRYGSISADRPNKIKVAYANQYDITQQVYSKTITVSNDILPQSSNTTMSLKGLANACPPTSSSSGAFIPSNQSLLDAIANTWANNWWTNTQNQFDWVFNGMPILKFCGLEDYIMFDMARKEKGSYSCHTRWVSLPANYGYEYIAIDTGGDNCSGNSSSGSSSGGGGGTGCGCCDGFVCITPSQAVVGGCDSAPNGAPFQMTISIGNWAYQPLFTPSGQIVLTYQTPIGCGGDSSSSSSSSGFAANNCQWVSCPICVTSTDSVTGCYQFVGEIYTNVEGDPAFKCVPVLISGTDWLAISETL